MRYMSIQEYQEYTRCINVLTPFGDISPTSPSSSSPHKPDTALSIGKSWPSTCRSSNFDTSLKVDNFQSTPIITPSLIVYPRIHARAFISFPASLDPALKRDQLLNGTGVYKPLYDCRIYWWRFDSMASKASEIYEKTSVICHKKNLIPPELVPLRSPYFEIFGPPGTHISKVQRNIGTPNEIIGLT